MFVCFVALVLVGWLVAFGWLVGCLFGWLVVYLVVWLFVCEVKVCLFGCLFV